MGTGKNSLISAGDIAVILEVDECKVENRIAAGILRRCTAVIDYSPAGVDEMAVTLSLKITPDHGLGSDGIAA